MLIKNNKRPVREGLLELSKEDTIDDVSKASFLLAVARKIPHATNIRWEMNISGETQGVVFEVPLGSEEVEEVTLLEVIHEMDEILREQQTDKVVH